MYEIFEYDERYRPYNKSGGELKNPDFVKLPAMPKGDGLQELLEYKRGLEYFAIWCLLLEKTTIEKKPENRGKLLNRKEGPASISEIACSISLKNKAQLVEGAISALVTMGWVIYTPDAEVERKIVPQIPPKLSKVKISKDKINRWNVFYDKYPRKVGRERVIEWFAENNPSSDDIERMLNCIKLQKKPGGRLYLTTENKKERERFIPHPKTWLNDGDWKDAPTNADIGKLSEGQRLKEELARKKEAENAKTKIRNEEGLLWEGKSIEELRAMLKVKNTWPLRMWLIKDILQKKEAQEQSLKGE